MRIFLFLCIVCISVSAQVTSPDAREGIYRIKEKFHSGQHLSKNDILNFEESVRRKLSGDIDTLKRECLFTSLSSLSSALDSNLSSDIIRQRLVSLDIAFNSLFWNYYYQQTISSTLKKALIFITSLSCQCTLDMCYEQIYEVERLHHSNLEVFDYAVVDVWSDYDIMLKYGIRYIPSVLLLNNDNSEIKLFERDGDLINHLSEKLYLKIN